MPIIPKVLVALPYVDHFPNHTERPDQRRIQWILNGECLGAAEHVNDNSGQLNRGPVQVQKNAETLLTNEKILNDSLTEAITLLNAHDVVLGEIGDDNLAHKVHELEIKVEPISDEIIGLKQADFLLSEEMTKLQTRVGVRDKSNDDTDRDVMEDLLFVKTTIGNIQGYDINGNPDADVHEPTGMKRDIVMQGRAIGSNTTRIKKIEDDWVHSDVSNLQAEITEIRTELGTKGSQPVPSVYQWSKTVNTELTQAKADIVTLQDEIGDGAAGTIDQRIKDNTTAIETNTSDISQNTVNIITLKGDVGNEGEGGSLMYRVKQNETKITTLTTVVGTDTSSGLQSLVASNISAIGSESQAYSILGRLVTNESNITEAQRSVAALDNKVGSNVSGSETGLFRRVINVESELVANDDKVYGRRANAWVDLGQVGIKDAPTDGKYYSRGKDPNSASSVNTWIEVGSQNIHLGSTKKIVGTYNDQPIDLMYYSDSTVYIGDDTKQTLLTGSSLQQPAALIDGTSHAIWTELNFADNITNVPQVRVSSSWKPLSDYLPSPVTRQRGGWFVQSNDVTTTIDETYKQLIVTDNHAFTWNTNHVQVTKGTASIQYTGTDPIVATVFAGFDIHGANAEDILRFTAFLNDTEIDIDYVIKNNMWSTDGSAYLVIQFPAEINPNDMFEIKVKREAGTSTSINVHTGSFYLSEL
jgi:hypothetical protein